MDKPSYEELAAGLASLIATWDRAYAMITDRRRFPLNFVDTLEDMEFKELQAARALLSRTEDKTDE